jgi:short-subunit dehydrogenase
MQRDKIIIVTGASRGLGRLMVQALADRGATVVGVARHWATDQAIPGAALVVAADVRAQAQVQRLVERVLERYGQVDVLVNNAGFGVYGAHMSIPWEKEAEMLHLDMIVVAQLTKLFLQDMLARNFGYVLLVSSIGGYQPSPTYASYSAAKSFVLSLGEALNYELRKTGVGVTVVSPGVTATEFHQVAGQRLSLYQRLMMMRSADVARIGIQAMLKRRPSVVPGYLNALMIWMNRLVPRRVAAATSEMFMEVGQR